jgi:hypothetical protein
VVTNSTITALLKNLKSLRWSGIYKTIKNKEDKDLRQWFRKLKNLKFLKMMTSWTFNHILFLHHTSLWQFIKKEEIRGLKL